MTRFTFVLGTHRPEHVGRTDVPLLCSRNRLCERRPVHRALGPWAIDCGAYTMLRAHGHYTVSPAQYVAEVRGWIAPAGPVAWASCQDWLCEPSVLAATGGTVAEHQRETVASYLRLRELAPEVPWLPVIQGWRYEEYWECVRLYEGAGVDLRACPLVGLGSVCTRQAGGGVAALIRDLAEAGIRLHAFGLHADALVETARWLTSADSCAWSLEARYGAPLEGCRHRTCQGCLRYALAWRERLVRRVEAALAGPMQARLW